MSAAWMWLAASVLTEVLGTVCLKIVSEGEKGWYVPSIFFYILSVWTLERTFSSGLDMGVAYAITGGGVAASVVVVGILFYQEPITITRAAAIAVIIAAVVVLNITGGEG